MAEELIQRGSPKMARLITVHRDNSDDEILLNADQIVWAEVIASRQPYTAVTLTGEKRVTIRETFDELRRLCG